MNLKPYYRRGKITLYQGDCMQVMPVLPNQDFGIVFTSPPYNLRTQGRGNGGFAHCKNTPESFRSWKPGKWGGGRTASGYGVHDDSMPHEEYVAWQQEFLRAAWKTLSEDGAVYYNHKPRIQEKQVRLPTVYNPGLPLRQVIIWVRSGGVNFNITNYLPMHEWVMLFAKPAFRLKSKGASGAGDIWKFPQCRGVDHPAPFPIDLPATAIETSGTDSVLDPFCGSGTTLVAAVRAKIRGVGIELNEEFCEYAAKRLDAEFDEGGSPTSPRKRAEKGGDCA